MSISLDRSMLPTPMISRDPITPKSPQGNRLEIDWPLLTSSFFLLALYILAIPRYFRSLDGFGKSGLTHAVASLLAAWWVSWSLLIILSIAHASGIIDVLALEIVARPLLYIGAAAALAGLAGLAIIRKGKKASDRYP